MDRPSRIHRRLSMDKTQCCATVTSPLSVEDAEELAASLAALADPVRLRLFSMIASVEEICGCDLQGPLGKTQPTISHHTKTMANAGLIVGEKRGRWVWWRAVPERLGGIRSALG